MPDPTPSRRDLELAHKIEAYGGKWGVRVVWEARRAGIPISLGCALIEKESAFRNVFGHDPTIYAAAGLVTKGKYLAYKAQRGTTRMQGVGPCQLTWWATQDQADRLGGCWLPKHNIRVGFQTLAGNVRRYGYVTGCARYNGSGPAADAYSRALRALATSWHHRLV